MLLHEEFNQTIILLLKLKKFNLAI
jgi:hypothetical protein